jgi:PAS domain S-box-containing protein
MLLRSPTTLESLNRALADQVAERVAAEQRVERANAELELRVQERTAELTQMNRALQAEIGERQRATREATRNEARLRTLIETAVDGIAIIDQRGQVQLFNRACERMFGYRAEDVLGRNVSMLMASPDRERHDDYLQHYLQTREARIIGIGRAVVGRRRDGSQFTLDLSVGETRDGDEPIFVGILRDISDRQRAEAELTLRSAELERSNRELESFAYVASHDLKAPLRGIDNLARWIEEDLGEGLHGETRDNMALLRGRVARLERLLDDILAYSRVGRQPDAVETFDPSELPETLRALTAPAPAFAVELAGDLAHFSTYRGQLEQVLANLVGNAIKHHDRDQGRVVVSFADLGDRVAVEVADDGPGIYPRFHQRIFEMFQTLRPRDQVEGSGMGLSIVRKLVESHGGVLGVVSRPPARGCRIRFTWPKVAKTLEPSGV